MIGVIADPEEREVVREFFELFKTPWEFHRTGRRYEVLVCADDGQIDDTARLVVLYTGRRVHFDDAHNIKTVCQHGQPQILSHLKSRIPIYGDSITFPENGNSLLTNEGSRECTGFLEQSGQTVVARIGYDLFREIRTLLSVGQPPANASMPALELHIALLRDLITGCGVSLVEIPPVPDGHAFIACLTHDVDHPSIRQHNWDHTVVGFLYRAVFGSMRNLIRGRVSVGQLARNWVAVLKLPLVHLGVAKDFWRNFDDRYLELEEGVRSTFFVIPFKDRSGNAAHGPAPAFRAARYAARDIADTIQKVVTAGSEIGLHGIDAWADSSKGREELDEIRGLTGLAEVGVRMHWLYYDQQSPVALEKAGASYDSTVGYNETVGYRAGTTQVYKPLQANRLLELPMHAMDTALFYSAYLGLSPREVQTLLSRMVDDASRFGGCLTINWHDRSLAPERQWGGSYRELVRDLENRGAWLPTAAQAVSWFRKRRSAVFETDAAAPGAVRAKVAAGHGNDLPGLRLRVHTVREPRGSGPYGPEDYVDVAFDESVDAQVPCGVGASALRGCHSQMLHGE
jgi:hypothetical protein